MLVTIYFKLLATADRLRQEERGDSLVSWLIVVLGVAAAAAAVIAILRPAIESAANKIVSTLGG